MYNEFTYIFIIQGDIMQRRVLAIAAIALMVVFINGLINDLETRKFDYETNRVEEKIKIRFMSSWGGIDNKAVVLDQLIREFNEKNPDIVVINESTSGEDFLFNLKTDFASNRPPDVFGIWPGSDIQKLIELGKVADLKEVYLGDEQWQRSFSPKIKERYLSGENIYSIPFEVIYEGLFINRELFQKHRIKEPENIEELFYAINRFNQVGITPIAYNSTAEGSFIYQNIVASIGGEGIETDKKLLEDSMIKAMEIMIELYERDAFPKNFYVLDDHRRNQMFINRKAAMIVQGSWFIDSEMEKNNDIGLIPFPLKSSRKAVIHGIGNGNFHITSKAFADEKKKEASLRFLKFLTSKRSFELFSSLPGFTSSLTYEIDEGISKESIKELKEANEYVTPIDHMINRTLWENYIIERFPLMLDRKIKPEEFLDLGD